uniref:Putative secreted protein n=1 Tax=Anopheles triannulatus TaxID=58253 RepID=A0A2M4B3D5_9DIPT
MALNLVWFLFGWGGAQEFRQIARGSDQLRRLRNGLRSLPPDESRLPLAYASPPPVDGLRRSRFPLSVRSLPA